MNRPKWLRDAHDLIVPPPDGEMPRLLFDIETSPEANWTWGRYQVNTLANLRPQYMLCFSYSWVGTGEYHVVSQRQDPKYQPDHPFKAPRVIQDRWVVAQLWHLFDQAEVLIAHNGDKFDIPWMGARQMFYDVVPPRPSATIDTLKLVKKHARFTSNRLNDLGHMLLNETKQQHHGINTWFDAMFDVPGGWDLMERYAKQDSKLLDELMTKLTPYVTRSTRLTLPNANRWDLDEKVRCPNVMCERPWAGMWSRGYRTRKSGLRYKQMQCKGCGSYTSASYAERGRTPTQDRIQ